MNMRERERERRGRRGREVSSLVGSGKARNADVVVLHNAFQCFHETKEAINAWLKQSKFIAASAPVVDKDVKLSSVDSKFGREVV